MKTKHRITLVIDWFILRYNQILLERSKRRAFRAGMNLTNYLYSLPPDEALRAIGKMKLKLANKMREPNAPKEWIVDIVYSHLGKVEESIRIIRDTLEQVEHKRN